MSQYVVSARKYRPDSFDSLIGQDVIARTLKNSIERGKVAHAYLFCGPRGVGKTSTARIFAKAINCSNPSADMEPCGECESCKSFAEGRSYCIHELDAASNNGVDDIKALLDQVQIPPQVGKYGVYIIDEVHMLSQSAFNAFLKTLEEPPAHAVFILATTEKHKIIPTILSRCQTYDFNRISVPDIVSNLRSIASSEGVSIDDEALHIIAKKADGAMRDALTIFDQTIAFCGNDIHYADVMRNLNVLDYEYSFTLVDAFLKADYRTALLTFDEILAKGFNALHFVLSLSSHLRDLIVSKTAGLESLLDLPASLKARYVEQASACTLKFLYDELTLTTQCEATFKASANQRLHIEYMLMKACFTAGVPQTDATVPAPRKTEAPKTTVAAVNVESAVSRPKPEPAPENAVTQVEPVTQPVTPPALPEQVDTQAETPTPHRRRSAAGASISLNSIREQQQRKEQETAAVTADTRYVPDDETVKAVWPKLAEAQANMPRLASTLANAIVSTCEEDGCRVVKFEVANAAQESWIRANLLRRLESEFVSLIGSANIRLEVATAQYVEQKVAYMPSDKAKELISGNPEVKSLVIDLGLDI